MSKGKNSLFYLLCVLFTIGAYYVNTMNLKSISISVVGIGVLIGLFDLKKCCQFFLIMSLAFTDFTYESVLGNPEGTSLGGIYMASVSGSTLMVFWTIMMLGILFFKNGNKLITKIWSVKILKVLIVMFFFSMIGFAANLIIGGREVVNTAISDIRFYFNIILGFSIIVTLATSQEQLKKYFNAFLLILFTQIVIVILSSYFTSLRAYDVYSFFSGTETYFNGVLVLCLLLLLKEKKYLSGRYLHSLWLIIALFAVVLFIFIVPSRGRIIILGAPIIIYLILTRNWKALILIPTGLILAISIIGMINSHFYDYFLWKMNTFSPDTAESGSASVRKVELINILGEIFTNPYYFFVGKGFGGFFQLDFANFTGIFTGGSYPDAWFSEGKFYKPHGAYLVFFLKNGFVMTSIFYFLVAKLFVRGIRLFKNRILSYNMIIAISFLLSLPGLSLVIFSSKLQLMYGMMLGFIVLSMEFIKRDEFTFKENRIRRKLVKVNE